MECIAYPKLFNVYVINICIRYLTKHLINSWQIKFKESWSFAEYEINLFVIFKKQNARGR